MIWSVNTFIGSACVQVQALAYEFAHTHTTSSTCSADTEGGPCLLLDSGIQVAREASEIFLIYSFQLQILRWCFWAMLPQHSQSES